MLKDSADLVTKLARNSEEASYEFFRQNNWLVSDVAYTISDALKNGKKILLFGNGGSAADAQHIAAEFVGRFECKRPPLPAIALTTDTSALTAIGNDYGFTEIFSRQIQALGASGDIAIGISTSGNSENVVIGLHIARTLGLVTILLTGPDGGSAEQFANYALRVPSTVTARIQEVHITIGHIICALVDRELFPDLCK